MTFDLGNRTLMYLVFDSESPEIWSGWGGHPIPLTPAEVAALPQGISTLRMVLAGDVVEVPGIARQAGDRLEWLIRPLPDPVVTMFLALPGPSGWQSPGARDTWASIGNALLSKNVSPAELIYGFPALFAAARAEIDAQSP